MVNTTPLSLSLARSLSLTYTRTHRQTLTFLLSVTLTLLHLLLLSSYAIFLIVDFCLAVRMEIIFHQMHQSRQLNCMTLISTVQFPLKVQVSLQIRTRMTLMILILVELQVSMGTIVNFHNSNKEALWFRFMVGYLPSTCCLCI